MRDRLTLPLLLPVLTVGVILLTIFSFGHLLLQIQETRQAWPVAIVVAGLILLIASVIANRPTAQGWPVYIITALPAAVLLGIGMFYLFRAPAGKPQEAAAAAAIAPPGPITEIATDNKFSQTRLTVIAGQQYTLTLTNQGQSIHNWNLKGVTGPNGQEFKTNLLQPGQSETIQFTVPQPGEYQFICDVHPTEMVGRLTAVAEGGATTAAAGAPAGAGSPGPGSITQVATDNKFSQTQLFANANERTSFTLQNRGSAIHNWHVLGATNPDGSPITTKLLTGGQSETITFTIAQPGTYDFLCDVHPVEMRGKLTVR
jgi:plastocyanin